jgi:hypothetical protein
VLLHPRVSPRARTVKRRLNRAWGVYFGYGDVGLSYKDGNFYVRAVRAGWCSILRSLVSCRGGSRWRPCTDCTFADGRGRDGGCAEHGRSTAADWPLASAVSVVRVARVVVLTIRGAVETVMRWLEGTVSYW